MGTVDIDTALDWRGRAVIDRAGEKIGTLRDIYLDDAERPAWASIHTGLFGLRETFVPLSDAHLVDDQIALPYEAAHVKDAPTIDPDVQLAPDEEERLYRHYQIPAAASEETPDDSRADERGAVASGEAMSDTGATVAGEGDRGEGAGVSDRTRDTEEAAEADDGAMVRSEEEVTIDKRARPRTRARLKKYVVTDYVEKKVPVRREEVRLEQDPPPEDSGAAGR